MAIKKIFALVLTICIVSALFTWMPVFAAKEKTAEFMANGGFEVVKDVTPTGWKISGAKFGEQMTVVSDVVHSGKNALKIEADSGAMFVSQSLSGLMAGSEYTLSAWVKIQKAASGGAIKFEFYTVDAEGKRTFVSDLSIPLEAKSSDWQEVKKTFTMPDTVSSANVMFRIWNGGLFYWDDISFKGATTPDAEPEPSKNLKPHYGDGGNLAKNSDFETLGSDGYPESWQAIGNKWADNQYVSLDKEETHSGNVGVKISTASGGAPWVRQIIEVQPNTEYQVSAWIRQQGFVKGSRDIRFKFEYYNAPEVSGATGVGGDMVSSGLSPAENQWVQMEQVFTTPPEARVVALYCRLHANGTVWFDDVEVYQTGKTSKMLLETDDVFYYPSRETGVAATTLALDYTNLSTGKVDFKLKDGDKILKEQNDTEFSENKAFFKYEISLLTEKKKAYYVEASLKGENGEVLETCTTDIYCYDRPKNITENGDYLKDGKVFIPTAAYHAKQSLYDNGAELGMNLMQIGYGGAEVYLKDKTVLTKTLDDVASRGMMGIVCLYQGMKAASHPDNIETTKAIVTDLIDHPGVFGYAVMDEPFSQIPNAEYYIKEAYKTIRDIDDKHPVYLLDANDTEYNVGAKYCDVFVHDPYPSNSGEPAYHTQNMSNIARAATSRSNKPFLVVNQAFLYGGYNPNSEELRNMWYQSLLAGAKGGGYYTLEDMVKNEEVYAGISEFAKAEQPLSYELFTYGSTTPFNDFETDGYLYKSVVKDGDVYMLVLNRNNEAKNVEVSLLSSNSYVSVANGKIEGLYGFKGTNPTVSGDKMTVSLSGRQAALFKISGASVDIGKLAESKFEDIKDYGWASKEIDELFGMGVVNAKGDHSFEPGTPITRGEFAMFLIRALDLDVRDRRLSENFADVSGDAIYARELRIGKALGILRGVGDNAFNPETPISRQDVMVICARGLRYVMAMGGDSSVADLNGFSDNTQIADYAKSAIAQMVKDAYIKGNADGTINPLGNTTRAEATVIMSRIVNR